MQNGPGWTGGDGTYSLLLPDGTNLWMWSDSYIGKVNPTTRLRSNYLFTAHNSLTIQNQTANSPRMQDRISGHVQRQNAPGIHRLQRNSPYLQCERSELQKPGLRQRLHPPLSSDHNPRRNGRQRPLNSLNTCHPNRAEGPIRACAELAEGNLLCVGSANAPGKTHRRLHNGK